MLKFDEPHEIWTGMYWGAHAFILWTTHGFPIELLQDMMVERGLTVDWDLVEDCYNRLMKWHSDRSRGKLLG